MPQVYDKDIKDIKSSLKFEVTFDASTIIVMAVHKDSKRNTRVKIPCDGTLPIDGYCYCSINDCCTILCCGHLELGSIEISYIARMRGAASWNVKIPVPEKVIRRYLSVEQRLSLRSFQNSFKSEAENITFEFVQMVNAF